MLWHPKTIQNIAIYSVFSFLSVFPLPEADQTDSKFHFNDLLSSDTKAVWADLTWCFLGDFVRQPTRTCAVSNLSLTDLAFLKVREKCLLQVVPWHICRRGPMTSQSTREPGSLGIVWPLSKLGVKTWIDCEHERLKQAARPNLLFLLLFNRGRYSLLKISEFAKTLLLKRNIQQDGCGHCLKKWSLSNSSTNWPIFMSIRAVHGGAYIHCLRKLAIHVCQTATLFRWGCYIGVGGFSSTRQEVKHHDLTVMAWN